MTDHVPTPPGDKELPLSEHLRELRNRVLVVLAVTAFIMFIAYPFTGDLLEIVWDHIMPDYVKMTVYEPLELIKVKVLLSFVAALTLGFPMLVYQAFMFMAPGLYAHEKKFLTAVLPFSIILFIAGALVAYFVTLPLFFGYILGAGAHVASPDMSMGQTFSIVTNFIAGFGIVFQVPLIILMAIKMGIVKRETLVSGRVAVYGILVAFAMIISPDPTMLSQLMVGIMLAALFEFSLLVARFI